MDTWKIFYNSLNITQYVMTNHDDVIYNQILKQPIEGVTSIDDIDWIYYIYNTTEANFYEQKSFRYGSRYSLLRTIFASLAVGIIICVIIFGNILVVLGIAVDRRLRGLQNWFIASLAVSDLMVGLFIMPLSLTYELLGYWPFGKELCQLWLSTDVLLCTASILNLVLISLDRYWSITRALTYIQNRTRRRATVMIAVVWLLSVAICIPPLFGWKRPQPLSELESLPLCVLSEEPGYVIYSTLGSFYLPLCVMVVVYFKIYLAARKHARRRPTAGVHEHPKVDTKRITKDGGSTTNEDDITFQMNEDTVSRYSLSATHEELSSLISSSHNVVNIVVNNAMNLSLSKNSAATSPMDITVSDNFISSRRESLQSPDAKVAEYRSNNVDARISRINFDNSVKNSNDIEYSIRDEASRNTRNILKLDLQQSENNDGYSDLKALNKREPLKDNRKLKLLQRSINVDFLDDEMVNAGSSSSPIHEYQHSTIDLPKANSLDLVTVSKLNKRKMFFNPNQYSSKSTGNSIRRSTEKRIVENQKSSLKSSATYSEDLQNQCSTRYRNFRAVKNTELLSNFNRFTSRARSASSNICRYSSLDLNKSIEIRSDSKEKCGNRLSNATELLLPLPIIEVQENQTNPSESKESSYCLHSGSSANASRQQLCSPKLNYVKHSNQQHLLPGIEIPSSSKAHAFQNHTGTQKLLATKNHPGYIPSNKKQKSFVDKATANVARQRRKVARAKERRATVVLGIVMASFIGCWLPFFLLYPLSLLVGFEVPNALFSFIFWLGYTNSALNPIIYTIFNRDFRAAFRCLLIVKRRGALDRSQMKKK